MKKQTTQELLDGAIADMANAEAELAAAIGAEVDASATPAAYAAWQTRHTAAANSVKRLAMLRSKLQADLAAEAAAAAAAAQAQLEADANAAADAASEVVRTCLAQMGGMAREMIGLMLRADEMIAMANRGRPDQSPLLSVEHRARSGIDVPRQIISEEVIQRWVFVETGDVILDHDTIASIVSTGTSTGYIPAESHRALTRKQHFRETTFLPAERPPVPTSMLDLLHIPAPRAGEPDGWAPMKYASPNELRQRLDALMAPRADHRQPQVTRFPLPDEAAANAAA